MHRSAYQYSDQSASSSIFAAKLLVAICQPPYPSFIVTTRKVSRLNSSFSTMVRRCAYGTCNVDSRYPDRMVGIQFDKIPNPKTQLAKSLRWIKACGRPHEQLHSGIINVNKVICSKVCISENSFS